MDGLFKDRHGYLLSKIGSILTPITEQSKRKFFSMGGKPAVPCTVS